MAKVYLISHLWDFATLEANFARDTSDPHIGLAPCRLTLSLVGHACSTSLVEVYSSPSLVGPPILVIFLSSPYAVSLLLISILGATL